MSAPEDRANRDIARHEAIHPVCNERYWYEGCRRLEAELIEVRAAIVLECKRAAMSEEREHRLLVAINRVLAAWREGAPIAQMNALMREMAQLSKEAPDADPS